MDLSEKKRILIDAMQECKDAPLTRVHFAWALPIPENIIPQPFYRITFPRMGYLEIQAAFDGKIETRKIGENEAFFFRLFAWDNVTSSNSHSLSIVYRPDFIRVVLGYKEIVIHNPHALSSAGAHAIQLLDALAQEKTADQQLCCETAKVLLNITRRDFALPIKDTSHAFNTFLEIKHFVSRKYDKSVNRDFIANQLGLSTGYISQLFKRYSNGSFSAYLTQLRLDKAEYLLLNTSYPLAKIAEQSGFSCDVHLIKAFRKHYGTSPARFRLAKKHRTRFNNFQA